MIDARSRRTHESMGTRFNVIQRVCRAAIAVACLAALTGCAFELSPTATATPESTAASTYAVRGVAGGIDAIGLVLENNGTDAIALSKDGLFVFATKLPTGAKYAVTVAQQPEGQTCRVVDGAGFVNETDSNPVAVSCVTNALTVGGTIDGLRGSVLLTNGDDEISVVGDGSFFLTKKLGPGEAYTVEVAEQPSTPPQRCIVANAAGITGESSVEDVRVVCAAL
jgi:hypothetical protein